MTDQLSDLIHRLNTAQRPDDRGKAASQLGHIGGADAIDALAGALPNNNDENDKNEVARRAIVKALIEIDTDEVIQPLLEAFNNNALCALTAELLGEVGTRRAIDILVSALSEDSLAPSRKAATSALYITESKHVDIALQYIVKNGSEQAKFNTMLILGERDGRQGGHHVFRMQY